MAYWSPSYKVTPPFTASLFLPGSMDPAGATRMMMVFVPAWCFQKVMLTPTAESRTQTCPTSLSLTLTLNRKLRPAMTVR